LLHKRLMGEKIPRPILEQYLPVDTISGAVYTSVTEILTSAVQRVLRTYARAAR
jgi:tagatose-1,6-bisphosphate aldolase non-catalytic subunit AgaZ/GatZ